MYVRLYRAPMGLSRLYAAALLAIAMLLPLYGPMALAPDRSTPAAQALGADAWAQIGALMREAEYQATPRARDDGEAGFWAPNRANDLSLSFGPAGLEVTPWQGEGPWSLTLAATAYGPAGATRPLAAAPELRADGERLEYRWPELREWYVNGAAGLKHNITLEQAVAADQLQVDLALGGTLRPQVSADGRSVAFRDAGGAALLDFGPLYVYDASGAELPARFGAPADGGATLPVLVSARGARFPITIDPLLTSPRPKVTAEFPQAAGSFGSSIAADGEILVVGAPVEDHGGLVDSGAAYVFTRNRNGADGWGQVKKLLPAGAATRDHFGRSVDVEGDVIVVGAPVADPRGADSGAAYVFERHQGGNDNWGERARLVASNGVAGQQFGLAVAVSGDSIAVGAPFSDERASDAGAVYMFTRLMISGVPWSESQKLLAPNGAAGDQFGLALALDGRTLVVGAPFTEGDRGSVYVFERHRSAANQWGLAAERDGTQPPSSASLFGMSVAVDGDTIVAGEPGYDRRVGSVHDTTDSGAVYLIRRTGQGDGWSSRSMLREGTASFDQLGFGVAIAGEVIVAGAPRADDVGRGLTDSGELYIYEGAQFRARLTAADRVSNDRFGEKVAIAGDLVAAAAPRRDDGAVNGGAAYLFSVASGNWPFTRSVGDGNCCEFGTSMAIDGQTLAVSEPGAVFIFNRSRGGSNAWGEAKRIASPQPGGAELGDIALDGDLLAVLQGNTAYIFERNRGGADNWGEQRRIAVFDGQDARLALDGDLLAVVEPQASTGPDTPPGRIEVFQRNRDGLNAWGRQSLILMTNTGRTADELLNEVALDGLTLAVTTRAAAVGGSGAGYVFRYNTANWLFRERIEPTSGGFGVSLALDGDTMAIGSLRGITSPGQQPLMAVDLFRRNQTGLDNWGQIRRVTLPNGLSSFGASVVLDGDVLGIGATGSSLGGQPTGTVYLFERNLGGVDGWGLLATLPGPIEAAPVYGGVMALDGNVLAVAARDRAEIWTNQVLAPAGLGIQAAQGPLTPGEPIAVSATTSGETGDVVAFGVPQGEISFFLDGALVGAAPIDGNGQAALQLPGLPEGVYELRASFAGNDNWGPCEAPPVTLFVGVEPPPLAENLPIHLPLLGQ